MIIAVTFTTTTGNVIRDTTDDFPTLEKATEELKNSLSRRNDFIFLNILHVVVRTFTLTGIAIPGAPSCA